MKAYLYLRVSGKGQVNGDGEDRQAEATRKFCAQHGIEIGGEFFEAAVSGTVEGLDRPEFVRLMETARPGDAIVVERTDRLARDLMVSEMLFRECRKSKLKVFSADQGLVDVASNDGDPSRKLIRQILGAMNEWEKSVIVSKLYAARRRKAAANGGRCEGPRPFGDKVAEKRTIEMMKEYRSMRFSYLQIATRLNDNGRKTRFGHKWTKGAVLSVLSRPENRVTIQPKPEPICEETQENKLQEQLKKLRDDIKNSANSG
jgi:DNA invertase Pin-like site-specific DNA recombinase